MPFFGAHMSIAGGIDLSLKRMRDAGGECLQIFTKNQRRWDSPPIPPDAVARFRSLWEEYGRPPLSSHGSYLVNPSATDEATAKNSIDNMEDELLRCSSLGVSLLVIHPGAHGGSGVEAGMERAARTIDEAFTRSGVEEVTILLENTAGQGTWLGADFAELAGIIAASKFPERLGVCIDTAHAFGAGYAINTREGYDACMNRLDETVGLSRVRWFHLNDSLGELGSHRDRHTHIGEGAIGLEGFKMLVNDPRFKDHPMALETPKEDDLKDDIRNLAVLRGLVAGGVR